MEYIARFQGERIQTVSEHLQQVRQYCAEFSKNGHFQNTVELCGILHDIGKFNNSFINYISKAQSQTKNGIYNERIKSVIKPDHGVFGAKLIYDLYGSSKGFESLTCDIISEVICYHHGGLPDNLNSQNKVSLLERIKTVSDEDMKLVKERYKSEIDVDIDKLFKKSANEIKDFYTKYNDHFRFWLGLLIKYLYSILVDADRYDAYVFESQSKITDEDNTQELFETYSQRLEKRLNDFHLVECKTSLEEKVKSVRENISLDCKNFSNKPTGIYTLTVPTGGGKTFASLRFALNHALKHKKQRIFYIVPYTTIIEQNANEVRCALNCKNNLLEYHSNVLDCNKNEDYEIISERWTSPIIFTTMVQFLNSIYATGNANIRRMHNLENSIIIFDEIQTLPIKCTKLFYESINFLNKVANSTIILCTATQPKLVELQRKIALHIDGEMISDVNKPFEELKRMEVVDKTCKEISIEELASFAFEIKKSALSLLIVMNKVDSANAVFDAVKALNLKNTKIFLLTARLCPAHRKDIIKNIKDALNNKESVICISTQLIEAGVDISFIAVIRSLAGLDSIAQTIGRGNRHGENDICNSYIVKIKTEDENLSSLYEIELSQIHTQEVLYNYKLNPSKFDNSLLSPKSIAEYFDRYYSDVDISEKMKYKIKDEEKSIYNSLLETNSRKNKTVGKYPLSFSYQFETARKNFNVIDSLTKAVIVPYNKEAEEIIAILLSDKPIFSKIDAIKRSQEYSVNIYCNLFEDLNSKKAFISCTFEWVNILSSSFYDKERGITKDKKLNLYDY